MNINYTSSNGIQNKAWNYFINMANERCSTFSNLKRFKLILNELFGYSQEVVQGHYISYLNCFKKK